MPLERPTPQEQLKPASDSTMQDTVSQIYDSLKPGGFRDLNQKGTESELSKMNSILPGLDIQDTNGSDSGNSQEKSLGNAKRRGPEKPYKPYTDKPEVGNGRTGQRLYTELPRGPKPIDKPGAKPQPTDTDRGDNDKPCVKPIDKPGVKPIDKPGVKPIDKPGVKPIDKPGVKPIDKPGGEKPAPVDNNSDVNVKPDDLKPNVQPFPADLETHEEPVKPGKPRPHIVKPEPGDTSGKPRPTPFKPSHEDIKNPYDDTTKTGRVFDGSSLHSGSKKH